MIEHTRSTTLRVLRGAHRQAAVAFALLTLGYAGAVLMGLGWAGDSGLPGPLWPAAGVALAGLLLGSPRLWPAVVAGKLLALAVIGSDLPWWLGALLGMASAAGALAGAAALKAARLDPALERSRDVLALAALGAGVGPAVSASIGTFVLWSCAGLDAAGLPHAWRDWWLGDLVGVLAIAPPLLAFLRGREPLTRGDLLQTAACVALTMALGWVVFGDPRVGQPTLWMLIPPVTWAALVGRVRGATAVLATGAVLAVWGTQHGLGPFAGETFGTAHLPGLQVFLVIAITCTLTLAAMADERRGRDALAASEQRLRLALEASGSALFVWDGRSDALSWLDPASDSGSALPRPVRGEKAFAQIHPEDRWRVRRTLEQALADHALHEVEFRPRRGGGAESGQGRWLSVRGRAVRSACGHDVQVLGLVSEVTRRVRTERELSAAQERLEQRVAERTVQLADERAFLAGVLDAVEDLIVACDADGKLMLFNRAARAHWGDPDRRLAPAQWASRYQVLRADGRTPAAAAEVPLARALAGEQVLDAEIGLRLPDGRVRLMRASGGPVLGEDGERLGAVISLHDITAERGASEAHAATEREQARREVAEAAARVLEDRVADRTRELEAARLAAEGARLAAERARLAAEAANRAKSDFLAHMSHEIRTPLAGVIASTDLLLAEGLAQPHAQRVQVMRSSAMALKRLLDDVLDLARIEAGRLSVEPMAFAPRALVEEVASLFSGAAQAKGVALTVQGAAALPPQCVADGLRLRQVLGNLVGNAVKFTDRGHVRLECEWLPESRRLRLRVADTGIGLTESIREHLFEPFEQAAEVRAAHMGGTGLGLAICRRLVELMGGTISADGAPGIGAVFTIEVPVLAAERTAVAPVDPAGLRLRAAAQAEPIPAGDRRPVPATGAPLKLLLAEDNALNQELFAAMLRRSGHAVDTADDGRQALDAVRARAYDAVLMDVRMPVLDGGAAARAVRALPDAARAATPIVALSADALELQRLSGSHPEFDAFVAKPIDWNELADVIAAVTAPGRRPLPSPGEQPLLDTARLAELRRLLGPDDFRALRLAAADDLRRRVQALGGEGEEPGGTASRGLLDVATALYCTALGDLARELVERPDPALARAIEPLARRTIEALEQGA